MKRITLLFTVIAIMTNTFSQTKNYIDQPYIEVTGKSEIEVVPDQIYLSIVLQDSDTKGKKAIGELEVKMVQTLERIGIDTKKQLSLMDLSSDFKFYTLKKTDIYASKDYQLVVYDAETLTRVLHETQHIGVSNISLIRTDHSDIEKLKQGVKIMALKNAKTKATALATAIDQKATKAIYIQEKVNHNYRNQVSAYNTNGANPAAVAGPAVIPDIEFDKIKLEYEVFCRFILE